MKQALLAVDDILSCAQAALERTRPEASYLPNVVKAQRSIDTARARIVALAGIEEVERNR